MQGIKVAKNIIVKPFPTKCWAQVRLALEKHGWQETCPASRYWIFYRFVGNTAQQLFIDWHAFDDTAREEYINARMEEK
jgi:hypothetical protein